jgi:hypothetical protein
MPGQFAGGDAVRDADRERGEPALVDLPFPLSATRRAIGRPARAITISSPAAAIQQL